MASGASYSSTAIDGSKMAASLLCRDAIRFEALPHRSSRNCLKYMAVFPWAIGFQSSVVSREQYGRDGHAPKADSQWLSAQSPNGPMLQPSPGGPGVGRLGAPVSSC